MKTLSKAKMGTSSCGRLRSKKSFYAMLACCLGIICADLQSIVDAQTILLQRSQSLPSMAEAGTGEFEWCGTHMRFQKNYGEQLAALAATVPGCLRLGDADLPSVRDAAIPAASSPFKTIRLKFNILQNDDGTSAAASPADVHDLVTQLNADYASARIRFVYQSQFIRSTRFLNLDESDEALLKLSYADRPDWQLNIYIVSLDSWAPTGYVLLGISSFPWEEEALGAGGGILLNLKAVGKGHKVLTHEIGHSLGLWHTHHGVSEISVACSPCYETADGRNGDEAGDFCSDTPPTPTNFKCQPPGGFDSCSGLPWGQTQPQNFMSYAPDTCRTRFTPQQKGRMQAWITERLLGWTEAVPTLEMAISGSGAAVTWPSWASAFTLESCADPAQSGWTPVSQTAQQVGNVLQVIMPATEPEQFFRLVLR